MEGTSSSVCEFEDAFTTLKKYMDSVKSTESPEKYSRTDDGSNDKECPECGVCILKYSMVDYASGVNVCRNCGYVFSEQVYDEGVNWKNITNNDEQSTIYRSMRKYSSSRTNTGSLPNRGIIEDVPGANFGSEIGSGQSSSELDCGSGVTRLDTVGSGTSGGIYNGSVRTFRSYSSFSNGQQRIIDLSNRVNKICMELSIEKCDQVDILKMLTKINEKDGVKRANSLSGIIGACIWFCTRQTNKTMSIKSIASALEIKESIVFNSITTINRILGLYEDIRDQNPPKCEEFIVLFGKKIEKTEKIRLPPDFFAYVDFCISKLNRIRMIISNHRPRSAASGIFWFCLTKYPFDSHSSFTRDELYRTIEEYRPVPGEKKKRTRKNGKNGKNGRSSFPISKSMLSTVSEVSEVTITNVSSRCNELLYELCFEMYILERADDRILKIERNSGNM
jgi:transcription initiation factor TFIIIB Brf1 subunit/transcription initiation factor TFIIB